MKLEDSIEEITKSAKEALVNVSSSHQLENLKIKFLGKKSLLKELSRSLKNFEEDYKPKAGELINSCKRYIESIFSEKLDFLLNQEKLKFFQEEAIDVTLPGWQSYESKEHVLKRIIRESVEIFVRMGFSFKEAPNIESNDYNFTFLNFSEDHPAREMHDTFYLNEDYLLRTHTSNTQIREMKKFKGTPLKIVSVGLCFRNEDISPRSHCVFHQMEAFYINKNVSFLDLSLILQEFFEKFFDQEISLRFRLSYFPFVEPGIEVDLKCLGCNGEGCSLCKNTGWLEVAGAGMIHPKVFERTGISYTEFSGYALGMGIERLVMLKYKIPDIRLFLENDIRFLNQF